MKQSTKAQLIFAQDLTWKIWVLGVPAIVLVTTAYMCIFPTDKANEN